MKVVGLDMDQKRDRFLDFQKAILIFCVVWTHCATSFEAGIITWKDNYLNVTVTTFQMPLFILISGYLFFYSIQRNKPGVIILKKILEVALPAAIWNLLSFFVSLISSGDAISFDLAFIKSCIISILGGLWYLWAYFLCSMVVCFVNMAAKNEWIRIGLLLFVVIVSHFVPANTWYFGFMFPFFLLGYYCNYLMQKFPDIQKGKMRYVVYFLILAYPLFWLLYKPEYSMYITGVLFDYTNVRYELYAYLIRFLAGLSGCAAVYMGSKWMYHFLCRKNLMRNWLCRIGECSLAIYILQGYMIDVIYALAEQYGIGAFMVRNLAFLNFVVSPISACILIAFSLLIHGALNCIPIVKDVIFGISLRKPKIRESTNN